MGASIEIRAIAEGKPLTIDGCKVTARTNPHGRSGAPRVFASRTPGGVLVYASDAGYDAGGAPKTSIELYRGADVLVHDSTYTPEDRKRYVDRGFSSVDDAVTVAVAAQVKAPHPSSLRSGLHGRRTSTRSSRARGGSSTRPAASDRSLGRRRGETLSV